MLLRMIAIGMATLAVSIISGIAVFDPCDCPVDEEDTTPPAVVWSWQSTMSGESVGKKGRCDTNPCTNAAPCEFIGQLWILNVTGGPITVQPPGGGPGIIVPDETEISFDVNNTVSCGQSLVFAVTGDGHFKLACEDC